MKSDDIEKARQSPTRLAAVAASGLRDFRDERLDRLTRLAVETIGVPAAFVSVVDHDVDVYISQSGMSEPIASSRRMEGRTFCHFGLVSDGVLAIEDARSHPVLSEVPTVKSMGVVAYVGVPLKSSDNETLGAFCVIDRQPRKWSEVEVNTLISLARAAFEHTSPVGRERGAPQTELDEFYDEIGPVLFSLFLRVLGGRGQATALLTSFVSERWLGWSNGRWRRPGGVASIVQEAHDLAVGQRDSGAARESSEVTLQLPSTFTETERRILALSYFDGLSVDRIAAETSTSVQDVRSTLMSAMSKLRSDASRPR